MRLSRLRLRLATWYAVAFFAGLLLLDVALYGLLRAQADRRLTRGLRATAGALQAAVRLELDETPDSGLAFAATETLHEWAAPPGAYLVLDADGQVLAERGPESWRRVARLRPAVAGIEDLDVGTEEPVRRLVLWSEGPPRYGVSVLASAGATAEENELLAWWLAGSLPLVVLLGLAGGYLLSRRALQPVAELQQAIGRISPTALDQRLAVEHPPDELEGIKQQVNDLLDRLEQAQRQNRRFLRQAAHQLRTPLTLVLGEASLAGAGEPPDPAVLGRIHLAAEQMQRRVNELFLLAEAQSGAPPRLEGPVDLESLLLEVADALRGRAQRLGQRLEFGAVAPAWVRGHTGLLREAVLELIENALRHGRPGSGVTLSLMADGKVRLGVSGAGPRFDLPPVDEEPGQGDRGLGLGIVRWIAQLHHGGLELERGGEVNTLRLVLPAIAAPRG